MVSAVARFDDESVLRSEAALAAGLVYTAAHASHGLSSFDWQSSHLKTLGAFTHSMPRPFQSRRSGYGNDAEGKAQGLALGSMCAVLQTGMHPGCRLPPSPEGATQLCWDPVDRFVSFVNKLQIQIPSQQPLSDLWQKFACYAGQAIFSARATLVSLS